MEIWWDTKRLPNVFGFANLRFSSGASSSSFLKKSGSVIKGVFILKKKARRLSPKDRGPDVSHHVMHVRVEHVRRASFFARARTPWNETEKPRFSTENRVGRGRWRFEIHRESFAVDRVRDPSLTESPRSQKETNTRAGSDDSKVLAVFSVRRFFSECVLHGRTTRARQQ